jgi:hypothetical protein
MAAAYMSSIGTMTQDTRGAMDADKITAIASVVIATLAVIATAWQAHLTRVHNRKSSTPLLTIYSHDDTEKGRSITYVKNDGLGPAIIEDCVFYIDGYPCSTRMEVQYKFFCEPQYEWSMGSLTKPSFIGVGQEFELFRFVYEQEDYLLGLKELTRVEIKIDYQSIYEERNSTGMERLGHVAPEDIPKIAWPSKRARAMEIIAEKIKRGEGAR